MSARTRTTLQALVGAALTLFTGVVVLLVVVLVAVPRATGSVPLAVLSDSMRPAISPGSVVVVRPTDPEQLRVGDIVTFQLRSGDPTLVTHRIVGINTGGSETTFHTKGDSNTAVDPELVRDVQIRGRVWFRVPLLGHLTNDLDPTQRGLGVRLIGSVFVAWALYLLAVEVIDRRRRAELTRWRP